MAAANQRSSCLHAADGGYIDVEMSSSCMGTSSPPSSGGDQFEFKMAASLSVDKSEPSPSPADELFFKGKLLPILLPPRLHMLQKLLQDPAATTLAGPPGKPRVSPQDANALKMADCSSFSSKCRWMKKLEKFSLGGNSKVSGTCLKSFFVRSRRPDDPSIHNVEIQKETSAVDRFEQKRKSFSGAILRHSSNKSHSSSSSDSSSSSSSSYLSFRSNGSLNDKRVALRRSNSADSEIESFIEEAIAHCKKSHQRKPHNI